MAFWSWLTSAGGNATADTSINWAEGQAPSSVNDSARSMMARLAEYRDDISGSVVTIGTSTAYTCTTNQVFAATPNANQLLAFVPHTTNGSSPTLAADGGTAFPIQSSQGNAVAAGTLVAGTPYRATLRGSAWILNGFYANPFNMPLAGMMDYIGATAPNSNFAIPIGQAISRTTFATLFAITGTTFGSGDGSTTFNLPDLRGRVVAGLDGGVGRLTITTMTGATLGSTNSVGGETVTLTTAQLPVTSASVSGIAGSFSTSYNVASIFVASGATAAITSISQGGPGTVSGNISISNNGIATFGSGSASPNVQPTMCLNKILRII
jgi:microcystin-dependent protein